MKYNKRKEDKEITNLIKKIKTISEVIMVLSVTLVRQLS